jgi:hypothetical protein
MVVCSTVLPRPSDAVARSDTNPAASGWSTTAAYPPLRPRRTVAGARAPKCARRGPAPLSGDDRVDAAGLREASRPRGDIREFFADYR